MVVWTLYCRPFILFHSESRGANGREWAWRWTGSRSASVHASHLNENAYNECKKIHRTAFVFHQTYLLESCPKHTKKNLPFHFAVMQIGVLAFSPGKMSSRCFANRLSFSTDFTIKPVNAINPDSLYKLLDLASCRLLSFFPSMKTSACRVFVAANSVSEVRLTCRYLAAVWTQFQVNYWQ